MCVTCATTKIDHASISKAREELDDLLGGLGVPGPVRKALDLSTKPGFDRAVAELSRELSRSTRKVDADMVREAIRPLDVAWSKTTAEQRAALIAEATKAARGVAGVVPELIRAPFDKQADKIVRATKLEAKNKQKLAVTAKFTQLDRRVIAHCTSFQGNFVSDEYGNRCDTFSAKARAIAAKGIATGISDSEISSEIAESARASFVDKSPAYWDVVASSFTAHSRSYSQMSAYSEAKIQRYKILAVLDEVTTPQCRFLDGKIFSVGAALDRFNRISRAKSPEEIKDLSPWIRQGTEDGQPVLYVKQNGERVKVADIERSGYGARDDVGQFAPAMDDAGLNDLGIGFPPYHGLCRTTTIAVL